MEILEVKVSKRTRMVNLPKQFISVEGENLQSKLVFSFVDEFVNGQARLEYETKEQKNFILLEKIGETYVTPVKNIITVAGDIDMQLVISEGTDEEEIPVFKSNKFYLSCNPSINAVTEAPDGYELWIEHANMILNKTEEFLDIVVTDGDGKKYLSDDGTYKSMAEISGNSNYNDLDNKPLINYVELEGNKTLDELGIQPKGEYALENDIPTNVSQLINDSGFLTEHQDLSDYALKNEIPDTSSFITKEVSNLSNYYNKTSIDEMIGNIGISLDAISGEVI